MPSLSLMLTRTERVIQTTLPTRLPSHERNSTNRPLHSLKDPTPSTKHQRAMPTTQEAEEAASRIATRLQTYRLADPAARGSIPRLILEILAEEMRIHRLRLEIKAKEKRMEELQAEKTHSQNMTKLKKKWAKGSGAASSPEHDHEHGKDERGRRRHRHGSHQPGSPNRQQARGLLRPNASEGDYMMSGAAGPADAMTRIAQQDHGTRLSGPVSVTHDTRSPQSSPHHIHVYTRSSPYAQTNNERCTVSTSRSPSRTSCSDPISPQDSISQAGARARAPHGRRRRRRRRRDVSSPGPPPTYRPKLDLTMGFASHVRSCVAHARASQEYAARRRGARRRARGGEESQDEDGDQDEGKERKWRKRRESWGQTRDPTKRRSVSPGTASGESDDGGGPIPLRDDSSTRASIRSASGYPISGHRESGARGAVYEGDEHAGEVERREREEAEEGAEGYVYVGGRASRRSSGGRGRGRSGGGEHGGAA